MICWSYRGWQQRRVEAGEVFLCSHCKPVMLLKLGEVVDLQDRTRPYFPKDWKTDLLTWDYAIHWHQTMSWVLWLGKGKWHDTAPHIDTPYLPTVLVSPHGHFIWAPHGPFSCSHSFVRWLLPEPIFSFECVHSSGEPQTFKQDRSEIQH